MNTHMIKETTIKTRKLPCELRQANARLARLSCGGGGLLTRCPLIRAGSIPSPKVSWFSADPRTHLQLAAKKGPPFDPKHQGRRQWRSPCDLRVPTTVLVRLRADGWQSLAGPIVQCDPACSYWMPRHSLPASSDRCLTGDGNQQW